MSDAAYQYAMNTMEQEIDVNQYALAGYEHSLRSAEITQRAQLDAVLDQNKYNLDLRKKLLDYYIEWGELPEDLSLFGVDNTQGQTGGADYGNDYGLKAPDFNQKGTATEAGSGGTGIFDNVKATEDHLKAKTSDVLTVQEQKMQHVASFLDQIIKSPNLHTPAEVEAAKNQKQAMFGTAEVIVDYNDPKYQADVQREGKEDFQYRAGAAVTAGLGLEALAGSLAAAGGVATGTGIGAPVGLALLAAAGLSAGAYALYKSFNNDAAPAPTITQGGYINPEDGSLVSVNGNVNATTELSNPYSIQNINNQLDAFIATDGNGLFRDNIKFKQGATQIQAQLDLATQMKNSAYTKAAQDNLKVRQRMIGLYGADNGTELYVSENGIKLSRDEFYKAYAQKYNPSLLEGETSGYGEMSTIGTLAAAGALSSGPFAPLGALGGAAIGSIFNAFVDDMDDIYDEAEERYNRIYNRGEVSGLGIGVDNINGGSANLQRGNRVFTFDAARPGPVKTAVGDLYNKDIIPALSNPSQNGATFIIGDAKNIVTGDEITNNSNVQSILSNVLKDSFLTKWKRSDDKRPIFEVERIGMTMNDPNKVAVTFTIDDDYINKNKGTTNVTGITKDLLESGQNKISVIFDKNRVKSTFFTSVDPTPIEYILNNQKSYTISGYEEFGGSGQLVKTPSGEIGYTLQEKYVNPETRQLEYVTLGDVGDYDENSLYEQIQMRLATSYYQNYNILRESTETQVNEWDL